MSDTQLNVDFKFNTEESKKQTAEIRKDVQSVNNASGEGNKPLIEREGILERIKRRMAEIKIEASKATSFVAIEKANSQIQLFEREIDRLKKVGRQGFDDMGKAIPDFSIPTGKIERLTYATNLYKKAIIEATNPELIKKYNIKLEQTQHEITRLRNVGKTGFDELGNKIIRVEKDTSTFVGTLSAGVERLRRLAYIIPGLGLTGLFALAWNPLKKLVMESGLLSKNLNDTEKVAERLGTTLDSSEYKKAVVSMSELKNNLELAKNGMYDKTAVVEAYNESIGSVSGQVKTLNEVEQGLIDNAEDYVKMMLYKAGATLALEKAAEKAVEIQKNSLKSADEFANGLDRSVASIAASGAGSQYGISKFDHKVYEQSLAEDGEKRKEARQKELNKELADEERIAKELNEKAAEFAEKIGGTLGLDLNKKAKTDAKNQKEIDIAVSAAQRMQQRIFDLKAEYTRKTLTKDEEEIKAVHDKFVKIAKEVEVFNLNPKNKVKVSVEGLDEVRDQAVADLTYKQETERLKISLSEQKKLYQDYEEYKISLGKEKADEKYRDLIDTEKSHLENLRAELEKIPANSSGAQSARKEELEKQIREEESLQLKKFNELLKANQSYQDKVKVATEQFESDRNKLIADGKLEEVTVLEKGHAENLLALNENHVKQLDAYKKLFEGIELLSNAQAKKVIADAKEMLANTDMPEALYLKVFALIRESEKALDDRIYNRVAEIGQAFDEIAVGVGEMNEGLSISLRLLGDMFHATSTVGKSIGSVKTGIADYGANKANAGGGALGTIAGVAAIAGPIGQAVSAVASLAKGIVGVFSAAKESRIQAEKELAEFDARKYNAEFEINALYRDRLRTQLEINKTTLDGLKESHALLKTQRNEVESDSERIFKALQEEEYVADKVKKKKKIFGITIKTSTVDVMKSLAGKSYEDIEELFISNQLTDRARELFLQLEKIKKEGVDVDKMIADNTAAIWEKATGTTAQALTDKLIQGFKDGYRAPEDFADHFKSVMDKSGEEFFRDFISNKEMAAFYEKYAGMASEGVITEAQRAELKTIYSAMLGRINTKYEDMKEIFGDDFLADNSKDKNSDLKGSYQRLSEQTGSELSGLGRGSYELDKKKYVLIEKMFELDRRRMDETLEMAKNIVLIEKNTADTSQKLDDVIDELVVIGKNTADTYQSNRDLKL